MIETSNKLQGGSAGVRMGGDGGVSQERASDLPGFSPQQVAGAVSKLISATIGDCAVVFSRSTAHKHYSLADIEWMILPAVVTGQVYVAEAQHKESGARAPVAVVLWASVSVETDQRLMANIGQKIRLRPDEWKSGDVLWIIDVAGDPTALAGALRQLAVTVFKDRSVKIVISDGPSQLRVADLHEVNTPTPHSNTGARAG
ncbi:MAG: toxin-activating lysine-acyltransferase [Hyphomicrobium sp.]|nr:toxin-activating lysine-acyltransferase [Hyphomicrobium sp.]